MSPMNKIPWKKLPSWNKQNVVDCWLFHNCVYAGFSTFPTVHIVYLSVLFNKCNKPHYRLVCQQSKAKELLCYEQPQFYRWNNTAEKKSIHTKRLSFNISNMCLPFVCLQFAFAFFFVCAYFVCNVHLCWIVENNCIWKNYVVSTRIRLPLHAHCACMSTAAHENCLHFVNNLYNNFWLYCITAARYSNFIKWDLLLNVTYSGISGSREFSNSIHFHNKFMVYNWQYFRCFIELFYEKQPTVSLI